MDASKNKSSLEEAARKSIEADLVQSEKQLLQLRLEVHDLKANNSKQEDSIKNLSSSVSLLPEFFFLSVTSVSILFYFCFECFWV